MMNNLIGRQFGNYRLIHQLGYGSFGSVYLGQHVRLPSQQAAIKILHLINVDIEKFQQEAETTASLVHPHIVRLFDFDVQHDMPFLVLDFAPHGSLLTRHSRGSLLPLPLVVQYLKEIALALQFAHEKNIIHRDIKPENILIGRHNELLLSDFGIAVLSKTGHTTLQHEYRAGGTPIYMAPEMVRGKPEKASDQYSLAIMVYEWLCGTPPFTEVDALQLGYQHVYEPVPSLREKQTKISPRVEVVIMRALAKKPEERFPSIQEFAQALEEASTTPPIGTRLIVYRGHGNGYVMGTWSPDGNLFVTGGDTGTIQVWDSTTNLLLWVNNDFSAHVNTLIWSPDSTYIASGSDDHKVQIWQARSGRLLRTYSGHSGSIVTLMWSPDGTYIASGSDDNIIQVWEASSGEFLRTYDGHSTEMTTLMWSPDGTRIASGSGRDPVHVWEASSGRLFRTYSGLFSWITTLMWSPDGTRIASASYHNIVEIWEASSGRLLYTYGGHYSCVETLMWSPDGTMIVSGSRDSTVQIWQAV